MSDDVNQFIAEALGNTGGAPAPSTAPEAFAPADGRPEPGSAPAPQAPEPFEEGFDINSLSPEEQKAYRYWQGAYTKKRQSEAERQREMEARLQQYEGVPDEAVQIARDYAARVSQGDITGARTLLEQQLQALDMLSGGQYGSTRYPAQGYGQPPYGQQPAYGQDPYAEVDPLQAQIEQMRAEQRMFQLRVELQNFEHRLGRSLTPLEQQKMLQMKQGAPGLSFEQIHYLANKEQNERALADRVRAEVLSRIQAGSASPPPPNGVPGRTPVAPSEPSDMRGIIGAAVSEAMRQG